MGNGTKFNWNGTIYTSYMSFCVEAGIENKYPNFVRLMSTYNNNVDKVLQHIYDIEDDEQVKADKKFDRLLDDFEKICKKHNIKYKDIFYEKIIFFRDEKEALREYNKEIRALEQIKGLTARVDTDEKLHSRTEKKELTREQIISQMGEEKARLEKERARINEERRIEREKLRKRLEEQEKYSVISGLGTPDYANTRRKRNVQSKQHIKTYNDTELTPSQMIAEATLAVTYSVVLTNGAAYLLKSEDKISSYIIENYIAKQIKSKWLINQLIKSKTTPSQYTNILIDFAATSKGKDSIGARLGKAFVKSNIKGAKHIDKQFVSYEDIALYVLFKMYADYK